MPRSIRLLHVNAQGVALLNVVVQHEYHGGVPKAELNGENLEALEKGLPNLLQHVDNVKNVYGALQGLHQVGLHGVLQQGGHSALGLQVVGGDGLAVEGVGNELGVNVALSEVWAKGGEGGKALAEEVVRLCEEPNQFSLKLN